MELFFFFFFFHCSFLLLLFLNYFFLLCSFFITTYSLFCKTFCSPCSFENILYKFSIGIWNFCSHFWKIVIFLRSLIGIRNNLIHYFFNIVFGDLYANSTIFHISFKVNSTFLFILKEVINNIVQLT